MSFYVHCKKYPGWNTNNKCHFCWKIIIIHIGRIVQIFRICRKRDVEVTAMSCVKCLAPDANNDVYVHGPMLRFKQYICQKIGGFLLKRLLVFAKIWSQHRFLNHIPRGASASGPNCRECNVWPNCWEWNVWPICREWNVWPNHREWNVCPTYRIKCLAQLSRMKCLGWAVRVVFASLSSSRVDSS
jgi:hypothetical protein